MYILRIKLSVINKETELEHYNKELETEFSFLDNAINEVLDIVKKLKNALAFHEI